MPGPREAILTASPALDRLLHTEPWKVSSPSAPSCASHV
jgi:hypothetical protein